jgi:hypothetical protein
MEREELLSRLAATPKTLAHLVVEADRDRLDAPLPDGGWSPRTILAHLRDDEMLCMRPALGRMLVEDSPIVYFLDGADWEPNRGRARDRKETLLADFALQRQATLNMFACLRSEDWARTLRFEADGPRHDIDWLLTVWSRHDDEHIAQLEAALGETLEDVLKRRARPEE